MTEFLIVLNSRAALRSFMAAGSMTLGANGSIAVGPLGRNGELSGSLNTKGKVAAMYSYSKTKGLFGGLSIEGSVIVERQDANCQAYDDDSIKAKMLLSGFVDPPDWAQPLIRTLESVTGGLPGWVKDAPEEIQGSRRSYAFDGIQSPSTESPSTRRKITSPFSGAGSSPGWGRSKRSDSNASQPDSYFPDTPSSTSHEYASPEPSSGFRFKPTFSSAPRHAASQSMSSMTGAPHSSSPRFSTHFESDFDPSAPVPSPKPSALTSFQNQHRRGTASLSSYHNQRATPSRAHDPFNLDGFDADLPAARTSYDEMRTPPLTRSPSPFSSPVYQPPSSTGYHGHSHSQSLSYPAPSSSPVRKLSIKHELKEPLGDGQVRAIALFDYQAQQVM